jgi:hypothetical protein
LTYRANSGDDHDWVWGCWRGRKAQLLYSDSCDSTIGCSGGPGFEVQGRYLALIAGGCSSGPYCGTAVALHDLARRRTNRMAFGHMGEVGMAANGTTVFTAAADSYGMPAAPWSVVALTFTGAPTTLDPGDVEAYSLAVGRTQAYWTRDGQAQSAPMP